MMKNKVLYHNISIFYVCKKKINKVFDVFSSFQGLNKNIVLFISAKICLYDVMNNYLNIKRFFF